MSFNAYRHRFEQSQMPSLTEQATVYENWKETATPIKPDITETIPLSVNR